MKVYESNHLIKSEDLNHHGTLFAARAASWLIEAGFVAAACEHGNTDEVVLRNLHNMSFSKPIQKGRIVNFYSRVVYAGQTSLMVAVCAEDSVSGEKAVEGYITFVTVNKENGGKLVHNVILDETTDENELRQRKQAEAIRNSSRQ